MIGRVWTLALGNIIGVARAMNLLSAVATAVAGGVSAYVIAHATRARAEGAFGALAGALCAGLMLSAWANATETEVYAIALTHVVLLLGAAYRTSVATNERRPAWILIVAYLIALIPAVHLSAMIGVPAALFLAARDANGDWNHRSTALLIGAALMAAGIGRMSAPITLIGAIVTLSAAVGGRESSDAREALGAFALTALGVSALLVMLVRAQQGPPLNQGNPSTFSTLADVIARRQYDVAGLWPRRAPIWLQLASIGQYADWQAGMGWGNGVFTSPARIVALLVFLLFGVYGWYALRRDSRRLAGALLVLMVCGTFGIVAILNMKAGVSIGYGIAGVNDHEARERDYFFVLGFWAWGLCTGYGALAIARARRLPAWVAVAPALIPLAANWRVVDRSAGIEAAAPSLVAGALLGNAPQNAVLFLAGDNDTYPIWYLQQVEGVRQDVTTVTIPLLGADWYVRDVAARTGAGVVETPGMSRITQIAEGARRGHRPLAVSTQVPATQRALVGPSWHLDDVLFLEGPSVRDPTKVMVLDSAVAGTPRRVRSAHLPDDVSDMMLGSLKCGRMSDSALSRATRDSLEVRCNLR